MIGRPTKREGMVSETEPRPQPAVVEGSEEPVLGEAPKKATPRGGPKWEADVRERVKAAIKKFSRPLKDLVDRDANEGDTRLLVTDFLTDALGFDKYTDLTTEYQVRGEFADYGIRIDRELVAFLETKRVATKLAPKHLRQVQMYAVNEGVEWVILTNGGQWQVYHLTGGLPVVLDLAFEVDLLGEESLTEKGNKLFYLSRDSLKRRQIDELWKARAATSPKAIASVLLSEAVLKVIRSEIRRKTSQRVEEKDLARILKDTVLRPECFEG